MILSHKHKFIFLHNRKTAGSSITVALSRYLGPYDIQTGTWDDVLKSGGHLNTRAYTILARKVPRLLASSAKASLRNKRPVSAFTIDRIDKEIRRFYQRNGSFFPIVHPPAEQIKSYDERAWDNYFKFSVVRNPWDHAVSLYYWKLKEKSILNISFKEFLLRLADTNRPDPERLRPPKPVTSGWELFSIDNRIAADYIARFELLDQEMELLSQKIGIPIKLNVSAKNSVRDKKKSLKAHYDSEAVSLVEKIYEREIDAFGYQVPF